MAVATENCSNIDQVGRIAGEIWHTLDENGPLSVTKLVKFVGGPRDLVMQGIGWLAREDKLHFEETNRGRFISLR